MALCLELLEDTLEYGRIKRKLHYMHISVSQLALTIK